MSYCRSDGKAQLACFYHPQILPSNLPLLHTIPLSFHFPCLRLPWHTIQPNHVKVLPPPLPSFALRLGLIPAWSNCYKPRASPSLLDMSHDVCMFQRHHCPLYYVCWSSLAPSCQGWCVAAYHPIGKVQEVYIEIFLSCFRQLDLEADHACML